MSKFVQSEIQIPDDLECMYNRELTIINKDTLKPYKLIVYYDSLDCSSCRISHLMDLYPLYDMADTSNFSVITIFSPKTDDLEEVELQLKIANHPECIYIDSNHGFCRLNKSIPLDQRFHCFLVNNQNRPIFVGNPIESTKLYKIFIEVLQN